MREQADNFGVHFKKLIWRLRTEAGEATGRLHLHALIAGLPPHAVTTATCFSLNRGDKFSFYGGSGGITGVSTIKDLGNGNSRDSFTEIPAKDSIVSTIELTMPYVRDAGEYPPYRFQSEIFVGFEENGRYVNVKKHNYVIDVDSASLSVTPKTPPSNYQSQSGGVYYQYGSQNGGDPYSHPNQTSQSYYYQRR